MLNCSLVSLPQEHWQLHLNRQPTGPKVKGVKTGNRRVPGYLEMTDSVLLGPTLVNRRMQVNNRLGKKVRGSPEIKPSAGGFSMLKATVNPLETREMAIVIIANPKCHRLPQMLMGPSLIKFIRPKEELTTETRKVIHPM